MLRNLWLVAALLLTSVSDCQPAQAQAPRAELPRTDQQFLQGLGLAADGPSLVKFFRQRGRGPIENFPGPEYLRRLGDADFKVREQASIELVVLGPPALLALRKLLEEFPELEVRRRLAAAVEAIEHHPGPALPAAAARLLRERKPEGAVAVLLAYLPYADNLRVEGEVLTTLQALAQSGALDAGLPAALLDQHAARRAAAALVVGRYGSAAQRQEARKLLTDPDAKVRLRAAQGLTAGGEPAGVQALIDLVGDAPIELARQAEDFLARLAGDRAPVVRLEDALAARQRCLVAWNAWWRNNQERLDLRAAGDHLVFDADHRAREAVEKFIIAYQANDLAALRAVTETPFFEINDNKTLRTAPELDKLLKDLTSARDQIGSLAIRSVMTAGEFAKNRKVNARLRRPDVRVVRIDAKIDDEIQPLLLFVRVAAQSTRIIGWGNSNQE